MANQIVLNEFGQRILFAPQEQNQTDGYQYLAAISGQPPFGPFLQDELLTTGALIRFPSISGLHPCRKCKCGASAAEQNSIIGDYTDYNYVIESPIGGELTYPTEGTVFQTGIAASGDTTGELYIQNTCYAWVLDHTDFGNPTATYSVEYLYQTFYSSEFSEGVQFDNGEGSSSRNGAECFVRSSAGGGGFSLNPYGVSGYLPSNPATPFFDFFVGPVFCSGSSPIITPYLGFDDVNTYYSIDNTLPSDEYDFNIYNNFVVYMKDGYLNILIYAEDNYSGEFGDGAGTSPIQYNFAMFYGKISIPENTCNNGLTGTINNELGSINSVTGLWNPSKKSVINYTVLANGGYFNIYPQKGTKTNVSDPADNSCMNCCTTPRRFMNRIEGLNLASIYMGGNGQYLRDGTPSPFVSGFITDDLSGPSLFLETALLGRNPGLESENQYRFPILSSNAYSDIINYVEAGLNPAGGLLASGQFILDQDPSNSCRWSYTESPSRTVSGYIFYSNNPNTVGNLDIATNKWVIPSGYRIENATFEISLERVEPTWYLYTIMYYSDEIVANIFTSYVTTKYNKCGLTDNTREDEVFGDDVVSTFRPNDVNKYGFIRYFSQQGFQYPTSTFSGLMGFGYRLRNYNADYYNMNRDGNKNKVEVFIGTRSEKEYALLDVSSGPKIYNPNLINQISYQKADHSFNFRYINYQDVELWTCPSGSF